MDNRRKLGIFLIVIGIIAIVGNLQAGVPLFSLQIINQPGGKGSGTAAIFRYIVGIGSFIYEILLTLKTSPNI